MKKLILVSMLYQVTDLVRTIEPELAGKTVTYIPTAGIAEEIEGMIEDETNTLESLGLKVDVLDVSAASYDSIVSTLMKNDIIFVGGGNTFYLLQELRRSGADKIVVQEVNKGKLYIGESAGAVIACPDIGYCIVAQLRRYGQPGESAGADRLYRSGTGGFLYCAAYRKC